MLYRLAFFFVLVTGFTGLVYQVTWHKYLSFYLGSHAMAAALVLAVFFLFLSLGYLVLGRNIHRIRIKNKLFVYGIIEGLIGFYALLSPEIFHVLADALPAGGQSQAGDFALGFVFTTLYIGLPTFLMGTTIPVLTQALSRSFDESHGTHAAVYGLNTLGAVFGALLTGFVLIDAWGLPLTLLNTGLLNVAIALATWVIWKARPDDFAGTVPEATPAAGGPPAERAGWVALLYMVSFASGFYVFSLENLMIRLAGLIIGSSNYTFAMIVAAFILGIALGSLWVGRRRIESPAFFLWVQVALLVSAIGLYLLVPALPEMFARIRVTFASSYMNIPLYWTAVFVGFTVLLLLPVALMGMNLPLIFNYLRTRGLFLSQTVGRIYAINTFGSVLGSLIGGYALFFFLNWDGVYRFNLVLIALTLPFVALLTAGAGRRKARIAVSALAIAVVFLLPGWDDENFLPSPSMITHPPSQAKSIEPSVERLRDRGTLEFAYHGPAAHIGVLNIDGAPQLHINGNPNTSRRDWELRAMNAMYPLSFVETPERAFVVGLGGGLSASIFAEFDSIREVTVSEIAIGAIKALPYFDIQNDDFTEQPYYDKVDFVAADAIKVLRSAKQPFDIIVSEPNHPWVAGVENLFSVEFLTIVRDRLTENGVYCQWFPLFQSEPGAVLAILNTFRQVFPEVRVFSTGGSTLSILAAKKPLRADTDRLERVNAQVGHRLEANDSPFAEPLFVLATEVLSDAAVSRIVDDYSAVQTFEFPVIAAAAFRARFAGIITSFGSKIAGRLRTVIPDADPGSAMLYEALRGQLDETFFDDAFEHLKGRGDTTGVAVPRLWYHRATWFDEPPDWPEDNMRAMLAYVSGVDDSFPEFLRADTDDAGERATVDVEALSSDDESSTTEIGGVTSGAAPEERDQGNRALDPAIRLFNTYRRLIRAQVPARLDRVVAEIPEKCEGERCLRFKLTVVREGFFDVIDKEELDALEPTDDEDAERIESLHEQLRGELRP